MDVTEDRAILEQPSVDLNSGFDMLSKRQGSASTLDVKKSQQQPSTTSGPGYNKDIAEKSKVKVSKRKEKRQKFKIFLKEEGGGGKNFRDTEVELPEPTEDD